MAIDQRELAGLVPALRRYARGLAGDRQAADDLVQNALVRALDRQAQYRGDGLAGWVFAILTNLARTDRRAARRAPQHAELPDVPDGGSDPASRIAILAALAGLPAEQREPLLLTAVEGFTYAEAAGILGVPVGTVMSRIARGRDQLAKRLEGAPVVPFRRVK